MSLNHVVEQGTIITDLELRGQEGNECLQFLIGVSKNWKPEGAQYPESVAIPVKAFKQRATFIKNYFNKLDSILIEGELDRDEDYTKEDGTVIKGGLFVRVNNTYFVEKKNSGGDSGDNKPTAKNVPASKPASSGLSAPKPSGGLGAPKKPGLGGLPKIGK